MSNLKSLTMIKLELFDLIHSLTMSEKRYFKIYSSKHIIGSSNDYVSLFDAIDKQKIYDEDKLKTKSFVKNLSAEKNYLYRLVLKALNSYHIELNSKTKIYSNLHTIEILFHKGLYSQARKLVKKTMKIATDGELFTQELSLNEIYIELVTKEFKYEEALGKLEDATRTIEKLTNLQRLKYSATEVYKAQWELGSSRSDQDRILINQHIDESIESKEFSLSERAEKYRLSLKLQEAFFFNDLDQMTSNSLKLVKQYEEHQHLIEFSHIGYVDALYSAASAFLKKRDFDRSLEYLDKLESIKNEFGIASSIKSSARIFFYVTNSKLDILLKLDHYEGAKELVEDSISDFDRYCEYIDEAHLFEHYFLLSKYYFIQEEFRKALRYSNLILNATQYKHRKDLISVVRLLNLLIHFELKNTFSLEYLTKNTYNYFKSKKRLFKVEKEMIMFITGRNKDSDNQVLVDDLVQLREAMKKHKQDLHERIPFSYFDFQYWAEAKLSNKRILEYTK
jgi:hypothetical protein